MEEKEEEEDDREEEEEADSWNEEEKKGAEKLRPLLSPPLFSSRFPECKAN